MFLTDDDPFGEIVDESTGEIDDRGPGDDCDRLPGIFPTRQQDAAVSGIAGAISFVSACVLWHSVAWVASLFS